MSSQTLKSVETVDYEPINLPEAKFAVATDPCDTHVDAMELRKTLGRFLTGVTVVTTRAADGTERGFTANSFTSVSLDPPLILVCIGRHAQGYPVFAETEYFAVNILAENQRDLSERFASARPDKFASGPWRDGPGGSPVLDDAAGWLACATEQKLEAGDHLILIGRVLEFGQRNCRPLGYHAGGYVALA